MSNFWMKFFLRLVVQILNFVFRSSHYLVWIKSSFIRQVKSCKHIWKVINFQVIWKKFFWVSLQKVVPIYIFIEIMIWIVRNYFNSYTLKRVNYVNWLMGWTLRHIFVMFVTLFWADFFSLSTFPNKSGS